MRRTVLCAVAMMVAIAAASAQSGPSGSAASPKGGDVAPGAALEADQFVRTSKPHQWRTSKLIGLDVYGTEDEKIGDIVEILIDQDGNEVVVIGIGGFLGIARRDVAVPFKAVDWRFGDAPKPKRQDGSGSAPAAADAGARKTVDNSRRGYPDFAFLRATKESLKAAPEFKYESDERPAAGAPQGR
jgi:sporulation protein YlmC with PRC-barrel domain